VKTKMIFYGDSIIRGKTWPQNSLVSFDTENNFVKYCQSYLDSLDMEIINKGKNGLTSDIACKELDNEVVKHNPNYLVLEIGGNDCNFNWKEVNKNPYLNHPPALSINDLATNLNSIIDRLRENFITVILLTPPPLDEKKYLKLLNQSFGNNIDFFIKTKGGIAAWHKKYVEKIRTVALEREIFLIDIYGEFEKADSQEHLVSLDGLHPTEKGYQLMAKKFVGSLGNFFLKQVASTGLIS